MSIAVAAADFQDELVRRRDCIVKSLYSFPSVASSSGRPEEEGKQQEQQQTGAGGPGKEGSINVVNAACSQKSFLEEEANQLPHAISDGDSVLVDKVPKVKKFLNNKNEKVHSKLSNGDISEKEEEKQQQQQQTESRGSGKEGCIVVNTRDVDAAYSRKSLLEEEADELQHEMNEDVRQIKKIFDNRKEEGALFELLRCIQSMELSASTLVATGIENSVRGVERHRSARVRQLARAILDDWAKLSSDSPNIAKAVTDNIRDTPDTVANPWDDLWPNFPPLDEGALCEIYCYPLDLDKLFSENPRESHKSKRDNVQRDDEACNEERKQENDCENLKPNCAQDSTSVKRKREGDIDQSELMSISAELHNTPSKRIIIASSKTSRKDLKKFAETTKKDNCEIANELSSTVTKKALQQCPIDNLLITEKLEASRMRIREGYNRAKEAKQRRRIQLLDLCDIPKPVDSMKSSKSKARRGRSFSNRWRR